MGHSDNPFFKNPVPNIVMPNHELAFTDPRKFINYSLDKDNKSGGHDKAIAYEKALGYTKDNCATLISQISNAVTSGNIKAFSSDKTEHGAKFKFRIPVTGPNGKTKNVIVVYQIDVGSFIPRSITNYLEKEK